MDDVSGARILIGESSPGDIIAGKVIISQAVVNTWIIMGVLTLVCIFLTHNMKVRPTSKRQIIAEYLVGTVNKLVGSNMGKAFAHYGPLVAALLCISACNSLSSMLGLTPATADFSSIFGWALVVFTLLTYWKIRGSGFGQYLLGYLKPIPVLLPINIISEAMFPVSMSFRHFGNVASGMIITMLVYSALASLSSAIFGAIPGLVGELLSNVPLFQVGIPAFLSIYFDIFSGCVQAFIFCMLMMINIKVASEG